ncbi:MAG TPA: hypothetical protein VJ550_12760 [Geomonas sp.]|nr:hypothetical protein [Geomonas sp.]
MSRSYADIISDAEAVITLVLRQKTGRIPKGSYPFLEYYCTEPGCDCRRVTLLVFNQKMKQKAAISFGFDQQGPFAGPYLDTSNRQGPYAEDLLKLFVDGLNSDSGWLERLYRHYRAVREKVEGKPYGGLPFPEPGKLVYRATEPPDLASEIEQSLRNLNSGGWGGPATQKGIEIGATAETEAARKRKEAAGGETGLASLIKGYVVAGNQDPAADPVKLRDDLRRYLLKSQGSPEELSELLPRLYQQSPQPDEQIQAALHLLFDALDLLDEELEVGNSQAKSRMEELQKGLGRHVFVENEDPDLRAAVLNILVQSKVDILPVLQGGTSHLLTGYATRTDLTEGHAEEALAGIARSFHSLGVTSPFEGVQELMQLLMVDDAQMQTALVGEMLEAEDPLLREIAVLTLFHQDPEVRQGVSQILAGSEGSLLTPVGLRRLIVSRNWFPAEVRKNVDQAITNARKARVECAALPKLPATKVFASALDGTGEQSFVVTVAEGEGFARCSITIRQGAGIVNSSVASQITRRQQDDLLQAVSKDPRFIESTAEHLDLRVCNALAEGARTGVVPDAWLVLAAELLGRDRWRPIAFDAARELLQLQEELASDSPQLLADREYQNALDFSAGLVADAPFLSSWYEDGEEIERETEDARKNREDADSTMVRILDTVMEEHRPLWLERLVVAALWLKSARKPPLPWHKLYHVAQAVADETIPLKEIPLMKSIAETSLRSYLASKHRGASKRGGKR